MAVKRKTPTAAVLTNLYDIIRKTIHDTDAYYTSKQIKALKDDPNNTFIETKGKNKYGNKWKIGKYSAGTKSP